MAVKSWLRAGAFVAMTTHLVKIFQTEIILCLIVVGNGTATSETPFFE
jgi:hypothetical protein